MNRNQDYFDNLNSTIATIIHVLHRAGLVEPKEFLAMRDGANQLLAMKEKGDG